MHTLIKHTYVSHLGIWPQTNIVIQNIHKTSCSPNQHAQILYYSHTKTNICANERKYRNRPFTDTYKQKMSRKHTAHNKGQQTTSYSHTRTKTNTCQHLNCRLNTKYSAKNRKHTEHMPLKPHRWWGHKRPWCPHTIQIKYTLCAQEVQSKRNIIKS